MTYLELESQVNKLSMAMTIRNTTIGQALIAHLSSQLTPEEVAGVLLVSLERLLWLDAEICVWAMEHLIPADLRQEIKNLVSISIYKQLIGKGLIPGKDFSIDAEGRVINCWNQDAYAA